MVRVSIADDSLFAWPRDASVGNIKPAVAVPIIFAASRRVTTPTVGRLIRSRQLAYPSGFPSMSLSSRWLHSAKRQWHLAQMPYRGYMPLWIAVSLSKYPLRVPLSRE
jgi:hypothetical protein